MSRHHTLQIMRWWRVTGDTVFAVGALGFGWFVVGLKTGWSAADRRDEFIPAAERSEEAALGDSIVAREGPSRAPVHAEHFAVPFVSLALAGSPFCRALAQKEQHPRGIRFRAGSQR